MGDGGREGHQPRAQALQRITGLPVAEARRNPNGRSASALSRYSAACQFVRFSFSIRGSPISAACLSAADGAVTCRFALHTKARSKIGRRHMLAKTATLPATFWPVPVCQTLGGFSAEHGDRTEIIFMVCAPLGWLISAACPTPRNSALGFHFPPLSRFVSRRDLLLCAKHLFVAAMMASAPYWGAGAAHCVSMKANHPTKVE